MITPSTSPGGDHPRRIKARAPPAIALDDSASVRARVQTFNSPETNLTFRFCKKELTSRDQHPGRALVEAFESPGITAPRRLPPVSLPELARPAKPAPSAPTLNAETTDCISESSTNEVLDNCSCNIYENDDSYINDIEVFHNSIPIDNSISNFTSSSIDNSTLRANIASWAIEHKIKHSALSVLLQTY
ncbi:hypothetical protein ILUMI_23738 [Ignelater luminosus]|uniref:Uncharacterized protein n=1 Tax=Ignelater luminosus TaxID=2038154 RepID=A0A8K0G1L5_IGNLU|nr:hypothetical protein ILUMI_23738 [Ignelater luminosus]